MTVATIIMVAVAIGLIVLIYKVLDRFVTAFWYYILAFIGLVIAIAGLVFTINAFYFGLLGVAFGGYLAYDSIRHIVTHRHNKHSGRGSAYVAREDMTIDDWGQQIAASASCDVNNFFDESSYAYCNVHYYTHRNTICFYAEFSIREDTKYSRSEITSIVRRRIVNACNESDCPFQLDTSNIDVKIKYE